MRISFPEETYEKHHKWGSFHTISTYKGAVKILCKGACISLLLGLEEHLPKNEKPQLSLHKKGTYTLSGCPVRLSSSYKLPA